MTYYEEIAFLGKFGDAITSSMGEVLPGTIYWLMRLIAVMLLFSFLIK